MAIPTFTSGYPPDGSSLGETKATIRDNLDGTFQVFSVDHQDQNEPSAGSHTKVSLRNTTGTTTPTLPPNIFGGGFETLYSQPAGSAPLGPLGEIFYSRAGGAGIQITGPGTPVKAANGYTFMGGGVLIQWGIVAGSSSSSIPVLFATLNTNFPNNCFVVQVIPIRAATSPGSDFSTAIVTGSVSTLGFTIANIGGHTQAGWYWIAIGN